MPPWIRSTPQRMPLASDAEATRPRRSTRRPQPDPADRLLPARPDGPERTEKAAMRSQNGRDKDTWTRTAALRDQTHDPRGFFRGT